MLLTWQQAEFLLKGVYLGLLVMIACMVPAPTWVELAWIAFVTLAGLMLCLGYAGLRKIRDGYRVKDRWIGFIVFLLLDNPGLVYIGLIAGLTIGTLSAFVYR